METSNGIKSEALGNIGNNLPLPQSHSLPKPIFFWDVIYEDLLPKQFHNKTKYMPVLQFFFFFHPDTEYQM